MKAISIEDIKILLKNKNNLLFKVFNDYSIVIEPTGSFSLISIPFNKISIKESIVLFEYKEFVVIGREDIPPFYNCTAIIDENEILTKSRFIKLDKKKELYLILELAQNYCENVNNDFYILPLSNHSNFMFYISHHNELNFYCWDF